ncbi:PKD domain-containing protein [Botrimarina mediterranea]|uniref:Serralysin C n=1 Tax=Botrimarina mediterranea TaxID=2528022 RepID=A0A518K9B9_9BACT|nr:PKD domain-containing protein [Botrimarina mediterranea]QDV74373.1 Serralysin C precursor [Botrimarina mediterranea]
MGRHRSLSARRRSFVRRQEQLEARLPLTADLALVGSLPDQSIDEGGALDLTFSFTDTLQTSSGSSIGLNPEDFASLGVFDPANPMESIVIDTDALTITGFASNGATVLNNVGASDYEIAVFTFDSFDLDAGQTITATGSRPFAILSLSDISIGGVIDVSANGRIAGPGGGNGGAVVPGGGGTTATSGESAAGSAAGFAGGAGAFGLLPPTFSSFAGSGGGFGGAGGTGGPQAWSGTTPNQVPKAGAVNGDLSDGIQGGGGGAGGRELNPIGLEGGGGGGGVEFGAVGAITVESTGYVFADGADGMSGVGFYSGAGGAGGGILMHANDINISGSLSARGGAAGSNNLYSYSGGGGGGRILLAHDQNGAFSTAGATIDVSGGVSGTDPDNTLFGRNGADGVVAVEQTVSQTTQDNYYYTVELLDSLGQLISAFPPSSSPVTDIVVSGASLVGTVTLSGLTNALFEDDADLQVRVTVTDDQATPHVVTDTFNLVVNNVAPGIVDESGPVTGLEGELLTTSGSFSDVTGDTLTFTASIGDVSADGNGGWTWTYTGDDDLTDTVTITANDGDGGITETTFDLTIENVDPTVVSTPGAVVGDEGTVLSASGSFWDVPGDVLTFTASIGSITADGNGDWTWTYTGEDDLTDVVTVTADDGDGGLTSTTFNLTVENVAPVVVATPGAVVGDEGSQLTASGSFSDVVADPLTFTASIGSVLADGAGGWTWSYAGEDDFAGVVTITANDGDGGLTSTTFDLTVENVAPVLTSVTSDGADFGAKKAGQAVTLNAAFTDAGVLDTHDVTVDWGDGTTSTFAAGSAGSAALTHAYADAGFYDVTVTLTDDDGGVATATTQSIISGVALQDGVLVGIGTNGNDSFQVYRVSFLNKVYVISDLDGCPPVIHHFNASSVSSAELYLGGGNDIGFVSSTFNKSAFVDGGAGDDLLAGGSANDILLGGAGNDLLFGGAGRDLLIGGTGIDLLFAEGGDDVLISGETLHDGDRTALDAILAEWGSSRSYNQRVDNLVGDLDNSEDGLNEDYYLIVSGEDQTVVDDEEFDLLVGSGGRDLYFAGEGDIALATGLEQVLELEAQIPTV